MPGRFRQRSYELEHLDVGDYSAAEYEGCIVELQRVNRWLGDTRALRNSLLNDLQKETSKAFSVLDVGAGSGELLRVVADWANAERRSCKLVGLELNARSAKAIIEDSHGEVSSVRADAFQLPFAHGTFDYVVCSLFTHHFREAQVVQLLREMSRAAKRKLFVIDLHRHPVAYYFYITIGRLFLYNRLIREDGALSILRSFTPHELQTLAEQAGLTNVRVRRSFPFRLVLSANGRALQQRNLNEPEEMRLAS
jgi:ubiquinone/menaquinone biosynthesis C-methylase UbiE